MSMPHKKAWIVFTNQTDIRWLRILKRGFRHCFIVLHDGGRWVSIDPMANIMEILVHDLPEEFDLPDWLRGRGHHVMETQLAQNIKTAAPIMLFTCVEACKRMLGIHNIFVFTPWQLYRHIKKKKYPNSKYHSPAQKGVFLWEA